MKRGPKPSGKAMTAAQRQARYRAAHAEGAPRLRYCRPADRRSMAQRWRDAVGELLDLQGAYRSWSYSLPANVADSATAEALVPARPVAGNDKADRDRPQPADARKSRDKIASSLSRLEPPAACDQALLVFGSSVRPTRPALRRSQ